MNASLLSDEYLQAENQKLIALKIYKPIGIIYPLSSIIAQCPITTLRLMQFIGVCKYCYAGILFTFYMLKIFGLLIALLFLYIHENNLKYYVWNDGYIDIRIETVSTLKE